MGVSHQPCRHGSNNTHTQAHTYTHLHTYYRHTHIQKHIHTYTHHRHTHTVSFWLLAVDWINVKCWDNERERDGGGCEVSPVLYWLSAAKLCLLSSKLKIISSWPHLPYLTPHTWLFFSVSDELISLVSIMWIIHIQILYSEWQL